ncbi:hypothetical protein CI105_03710 [Candidatus Izimaplasma bacterium ZiA1]|uniref:hypothetical protein n=1 Tax=Candidatus Izimoplasma sp. ZiA1 TaxID=2024899 RepID=UPI000BAA8B66|nr:hypothetical protein CI105_03710 [Candidatus Izimaplasma bacterium ZiA1]
MLVQNDKFKTTLVLLTTVLFVFIFSRDFFLDFNAVHPLIGAFTKFFFLASIGDFIANRFQNKKWIIPKNIIPKAFIWGLIGIMIVYMFKIYPVGVTNLMDLGFLPFKDNDIMINGNGLFWAFSVSFVMNLTFAPAMMIFHKFTDTYLNNYKLFEKTSFTHLSEITDWTSFFKLIILKTIPFFWIPAHTITFILPKEYQVIFAALLGIFLGLFLGLSKKGKK